MELEGRTALLTGATGGLGRAIATELAGRGVSLVLSSRSKQELDELSAALPGGGHRALVFDLAEPGAAERLAAEAGAVDVLVANAGVGAAGRVESFPAERIERVLRVNLEAPILLARALVEPMRERGSGQIVLISSLAGKAITGRSTLYSTTKGALRTFGIGLRRQLRGSGVGVSVVSPGFIREAGMFAQSGADPGVLGTRAPADVGRGVARAIERDLAELEVAPARQRLAAAIGVRRPHLIARLG